MNHHYPNGVSWQWPDTIPLTRRVTAGTATVPCEPPALPPEPPRQRRGLLLAAVVACAGIAACVACEWPQSDQDAPSEEQGGGILVRQYRTDGGRWRMCVYSDGFQLTIGPLDICPAAD